MPLGGIGVTMQDLKSGLETGINNLLKRQLLGGPTSEDHDAQQGIFRPKSFYIYRLLNNILL
jgi:hypothetical protein